MAGLYKRTFGFEREQHTVFHSGYATLHPHHNEWDCPLHPCPALNQCRHAFGFGLPSRCAVVSHCCFSL